MTPEIIFGCIAVLGGLYMAALRPMEAEAIRLRKDSERLAEAVLIQNAKIAQLENRLIVLEHKTNNK